MTSEVLGEAIRQDKRNRRRDASQPEGDAVSMARLEQRGGGERGNPPKDDGDRIRFLAQL